MTRENGSRKEMTFHLKSYVASLARALMASPTLHNFLDNPDLSTSEFCRAHEARRIGGVSDPP